MLSYRALTIGMVALIALCAFESLAVTTAMPAVAEALDGVSLYAVSFGGALAASIVGMVVAGQWSDERGPAMALWTGITLFVAGLLIDGLAPSMLWLLAGRVVQGLGSGSISVALYVVVARVFPAALQPRVFAAFSAAWVVPSLIGPTLSGLIVQHMGWRWVFLVVPLLAVPVILLLHFGLRTAAMNHRPATTAHRAADRRTAWALIAAIGAGLLYGASQLHGLASIVLCVIAFVGLLLATRHLLPSGTLRAQRGLPSVIALRGIATAALFGTEAFIPLLLSHEYRLSPLWAGCALTIAALGWSCGSWYQGSARRRWTHTQLLKSGMGLMVLGILLLSAVTALVTLHSTTWAAVAMIVGMLTGLAITGAGIGLVYPRLSVLTFELSPPDKQGWNSSALQLADALGITSVLAIEGWLFTLLSQHSAAAAYLTTFAITGVLALLGLALSSRTQRTMAA